MHKLAPLMGYLIYMVRGRRTHMQGAWPFGSRSANSKSHSQETSHDARMLTTFIMAMHSRNLMGFRPSRSSFPNDGNSWQVNRRILMSSLGNSLQERGQSGKDLLRVRGGSADELISEKFEGELQPREKDMIKELVDLGQQHIFESWAPAGIDEEKKRTFLTQVAELNNNYPGGLRSYISKAQDLLEKSASGANPFEGFTPHVPEGDILSIDDGSYEAMEKEGLKAAEEGVGFVLVAGGLGERLGYDGIKVAIPVDLLTKRCFLQHYIEFILALGRRIGKPIPFTIMTSDDTDARTRELLQKEKNFGMPDSQLRIVKQEKVAALSDRHASLAMLDPYTIETKPHGHGDVHQLLHKEGVLSDWQAAGIKRLFFIQDTNVLVLNSILPALGVAKKRDLDMNSICVPRTAGEAAGAITKLVNEQSGEELTINVEYNQLDPLLRATISPDLGDVNDPGTGHSPFPGNVNNLIFKLDSYKRVCEGKAQGVVPEFVNPKYADAERERFKKPTRLECMMQDFPRLMQEELPQGTSKVGFVSFPKWLSFNPAKNSLEGGVTNLKNGNPAGTVAASESNFYDVFSTRMADFGTAFTGDAASVEIKGIPQEVGPYIYISPDISLTTESFRSAFNGSLTMDRQSALQIEGEGSLSFQDVELDGDLTIELVKGAHLRLEGTRIHTGKPRIETLSEDASAFLTIRGYDLSRAGDRVIIRITQPGTWVVGESPDEVRRLKKFGPLGRVRL